MNQHVFGFALAGAGFLLMFAPPVGATTLLPNTSTFTPDVITSPPASPDASVTITLTDLIGTPYPDGVKVTENVYLNQTHGGVTGALFAYQITNNSSPTGSNDGIETISVTTYPSAAGNPSIDVGYSTGNGGSFAPNEIDWQSVALTKGNVNFDFGSNLLPKGGTTYFLYVQTSAPGFDSKSRPSTAVLQVPAASWNRCPARSWAPDCRA